MPGTAPGRTSQALRRRGSDARRHSLFHCTKWAQCVCSGVYAAAQKLQFSTWILNRFGLNVNKMTACHNLWESASGAWLMRRQFTLQNRRLKDHRFDWKTEAGHSFNYAKWIFCSRCFFSNIYHNVSLWDLDVTASLAWWAETVKAERSELSRV